MQNKDLKESVEQDGNLNDVIVMHFISVSVIQLAHGQKYGQFESH